MNRQGNPRPPPQPSYQDTVNICAGQLQNIYTPRMPQLMGHYIQRLPSSNTSMYSACGGQEYSRIPGGIAAGSNPVSNPVSPNMTIGHYSACTWQPWPALQEWPLRPEAMQNDNFNPGIDASVTGAHNISVVSPGDRGCSIPLPPSTMQCGPSSSVSMPRHMPFPPGTRLYNVPLHRPLLPPPCNMPRFPGEGTPTKQICVPRWVKPPEDASGSTQRNSHSSSSPVGCSFESNQPAASHTVQRFPNVATHSQTFSHNPSPMSVQAPPSSNSPSPMSVQALPSSNNPSPMSAHIQSYSNNPSPMSFQTRPGSNNRSPLPAHSQSNSNNPSPTCTSAHTRSYPNRPSPVSNAYDGSGQRPWAAELASRFDQNQVDEHSSEMVPCVPAWMNSIRSEGPAMSSICTCPPGYSRMTQIPVSNLPPCYLPNHPRSQEISHEGSKGRTDGRMNRGNDGSAILNPDVTRTQQSCGGTNIAPIMTEENSDSGLIISHVYSLASRPQGDGSPPGNLCEAPLNVGNYAIPQYFQEQPPRQACLNGNQATCTGQSVKQKRNRKATNQARGRGSQSGTKAAHPRVSHSADLCIPAHTVNCTSNSIGRIRWKSSGWECTCLTEPGSQSRKRRKSASFELENMISCKVHRKGNRELLARDTDEHVSLLVDRLLEPGLSGPAVRRQIQNREEVETLGENVTSLTQTHHDSISLLRQKELESESSALSSGAIDESPLKLRGDKDICSTCRCHHDPSANISHLQSRCPVLHQLLFDSSASKNKGTVQNQRKKKRKKKKNSTAKKGLQCHAANVTRKNVSCASSGKMRSMPELRAEPVYSSVMDSSMRLRLIKVDSQMEKVIDASVKEKLAEAVDISTVSAAPGNRTIASSSRNEEIIDHGDGDHAFDVTSTSVNSIGENRLVEADSTNPDVTEALHSDDAKICNSLVSLSDRMYTESTTVWTPEAEKSCSSMACASKTQDNISSGKTLGIRSCASTCNIFEALSNSISGIDTSGTTRAMASMSGFLGVGSTSSNSPETSKLVPKAEKRDSFGSGKTKQSNTDSSCISDALDIGNTCKSDVSQNLTNSSSITKTGLPDTSLCRIATGANSKGDSYITDQNNASSGAGMPGIDMETPGVDETIIKLDDISGAASCSLRIDLEDTSRAGRTSVGMEDTLRPGSTTSVDIEDTLRPCSISVDMEDTLIPCSTKVGMEDASGAGTCSTGIIDINLAKSSFGRGEATGNVDTGRLKSPLGQPLTPEFTTNQQNMMDRMVSGDNKTGHSPRIHRSQLNLNEHHSKEGQVKESFPSPRVELDVMDDTFEQFDQNNFDHAYIPLLPLSPLDGSMSDSVGVCTYPQAADTCPSGVQEKLPSDGSEVETMAVENEPEPREDSSPSSLVDPFTRKKQCGNVALETIYLDKGPLDVCIQKFHGHNLPCLKLPGGSYFLTTQLRDEVFGKISRKHFHTARAQDLMIAPLKLGRSLVSHFNTASRNKGINVKMKGGLPFLPYLLSIEDAQRLYTYFFGLKKCRLAKRKARNSNSQTHQCETYTYDSHSKAVVEAGTDLVCGVMLRYIDRDGVRLYPRLDLCCEMISASRSVQVAMMKSLDTGIPNLDFHIAREDEAQALNRMMDRRNIWVDISAGNCLITQLTLKPILLLLGAERHVEDCFQPLIVDCDPRMHRDKPMQMLVKGGMTDIFGPNIRFVLTSEGKEYVLSDVCDAFGEAEVVGWIKDQDLQIRQCSPNELQFLENLSGYSEFKTEVVSLVTIPCLFELSRAQPNGTECATTVRDIGHAADDDGQATDHSTTTSVIDDGHTAHSSGPEDLSCTVVLKRWRPTVNDYKSSLAYRRMERKILRQRKLDFMAKDGGAGDRHMESDYRIGPFMNDDIQMCVRPTETIACTSDDVDFTSLDTDGLSLDFTNVLTSNGLSRDYEPMAATVSHRQGLVCEEQGQFMRRIYTGKDESSHVDRSSPEQGSCE